MKQPVPIFEKSRISYYSLTALFALTFDCIFSVYESGACFSPDVLDITSEDILSRFVEVCPTRKSEKDVTQVTYNDLKFTRFKIDFV